MGTGVQSVPSIQVVAAVLRDAQGRVLIAERPAGKPMAGFWEFPGGKLEPGEPTRLALRRELQEELGIHVEQAHRLLTFSHLYPERQVYLDVWRVARYTGTPASHEGQRLAWVLPSELQDWKLLPADEPILAALKLPPLMLVTPAPDDERCFLSGLERSLLAGLDFVQFRAPDLAAAPFERLAREVIRLCRQHGARVHLNSTPDIALRLGADGVHLSQARLRSHAPTGIRGLSLGVSCHTPDEIALALEHQPAYLTLGTLAGSPSHPDAKPLGWERFMELARLSPAPVYAIGGLGLQDLESARAHGAHGIAAIRGLWDILQLSEGS
jgi:8-oxo-dGTP diphosphatase